jgi:uncharacterized phage protein (TIGR02218 family)
MKNIPEMFQYHIENSNVFTIAICWKVTRIDGQVLGFTNHTEDIVVDGVAYRAETGYKASSINQTSDLSTDDLDVIGILNNDGLSETDLEAGLYDYAEIEIFLVNYHVPTAYTTPIRKGKIGNVQKGTDRFTAELRSLMEELNVGTVGVIATPTCQAQLGDYHCQVNLTSYVENGTVTTVISNREFTDNSLSNDNNYFQFGVLEWLTGSNAGLKMEVKSWDVDTHTMKLMLPLPYAIQVGDVYKVHAGCNKTREACHDRFSNVVNFYMGFPDLPGVQALLQECS